MENKEENKILIGKDNIIYIEITKEDLSGEYILELMKEAIEVIRKFSGKAKLLAKFSKPVLKVGSSKERKKMVKLIEDAYKDPGFDKLAICGVNTLLKIVSFFVVKATKIENIRIFESKEEALKWLKSDS